MNDAVKDIEKRATVHSPNQLANRVTSPYPTFAFVSIFHHIPFMQWYQKQFLSRMTLCVEEFPQMYTQHQLVGYVLI